MLDIDKENGNYIKLEDKGSLLKNLLRNREKYRKEIEKGKVERRPQFEIGEKVLLFRKSQNKMGANWTPGYRIIGRFNKDAFEVQRGKIKLRANKIHLKKHFS